MKTAIVALVGIALVAVGVAPAWWVKGHESITEAAASRLPDDVPAFFRAAGKHLAHFAGDPDRWKNRECKTLRASIEGDHFIDLEDLEGKDLPRESRFKGMDLMRGLKKEPNKVGLLPYAIEEGYEKLACAFYDYRQDPTNEAIRMKCLVYAGNLAHFTTDASMPLHTTIHFDGRVREGMEKLQKGIHAKVDAFPEKFKLSPEEMARDLTAAAQDDVWAYAQKFLKESYTHIDKCYEFDAVGAFEKPTDDSRAFILTRCRAGAQFTMDVWYSAWKRSASLPTHY
jgi:hypothetical protein